VNGAGELPLLHAATPLKKDNKKARAVLADSQAPNRDDKPRA